MTGLRACVVAEIYPGAHDPTLGIWAHRQALATRDAGAEVRVICLHRPVPPLAAGRDLVRRRDARMLREWAVRERHQPRRTRLDGIEVRYARFLAPPRPLSYGSWGLFARPALQRALEALYREWPFDVVHAHYAIPAGHAARSWARRRSLPLAISVHGGDVYWTSQRSRLARRTVASVLRDAGAVLCNSSGTLERVAALGVDRTRLRMVRLGARPPDPEPERRQAPTIVSSGYLVERKRHADVIRALPRIRELVPGCRYLVVGDGPERERLTELAAGLGVADAVELPGRLGPQEALRAVAGCHVMALPSVDEAFGVAYVEAMAAGVPAVGCAGEAGPEEIAALGGGLVRVPPRDPDALARTLSDLLSDEDRRSALGAQARRTALEHFSWERCGEQTVEAYREAARATGAGDRRAAAGV